MANLNAIMMK